MTGSINERSFFSSFCVFVFRTGTRRLCTQMDILAAGNTAADSARREKYVRAEININKIQPTPRTKLERHSLNSGGDKKKTKTAGQGEVLLLEVSSKCQPSP